MKKLFPLFLLLACFITANAQSDSPTLSADRPGLAQLAKADGTLHPAEKLYLQTLGHELGYADDALKVLME